MQQKEVTSSMGKEGKVLGMDVGFLNKAVKRYHLFQLDRALGKTAGDLGLSQSERVVFKERAWSVINRIDRPRKTGEGLASEASQPDNSNQ